MSLKAFHLFFMSVCIMAALGFGVWGVLEYRHRDETASLIMGVIALGSIPLMVIYTVWFLRKLKNVSFL